MSEPLGLDADNAKPRKHAEGGVGETIKVVIQALLIALVVRTLLFQPFNIPSGSMIPTLLVGDFLFVSKYSYGYSRYSIPFSPDLFPGRVLASKPKRGDVAVFKLPRDTSQDYIKRVIGLPGDKIQEKGGRLYINDQMVPREPIEPVKTEDRYGHRTEVPTYKETLPGGVTHTIIEIEGDESPNGMVDYRDNTGVYEVPPDHYFMMGDNRDNSMDSRVPPEQGGVGYVPSEDLVGRAEMIFFSVREPYAAWEFWMWPWTVRFDRLFQPVR